MPTYDYKCPRGHVFEKFYPKISNRQRMPCPKCGKQAVRQISGGAGLVFKGSGFYVTDYKRAGDAKKAEGEAKPEGAKSEAKPSKKDHPSDK